MISKPYTPHDYQKEAIKFIIEHGNAGLFLDPGLGKTSITYASFRILQKQKLAKRMLVIAPLRPAHSVWPKEALKWEEFEGLRVHVLHGDNKDYLLDTPHDVSVINPEGLQWLFAAQEKKRTWWWDMLVVDESTRFKHANTLRWRTLRPVLNRFRRRVILTGSPAPNGLLDLFGQIYILDMGYSLGRFITHYRNTYFDASGYGGYTWIPKPGADRQIYEKLKPLVLRMKAEDYLNLPPLLFNDVELELPEKAAKQYLQMEALLVADVNNGKVVAANAAAASGKCRQIANGGIYTGENDEYEQLHKVKAEAALELMEELNGKPALIAYEFKHDLERLLETFPGAQYLGGGVSTKKAAEIEEAWNAGDLPVLLAQPQSVAHGLNLQGVGAAVIFHSIPWDLENYEQLIRRVWRQGQTERVMVHHLVMKGTVDEVVLKTLKKKDKTQAALLKALKEYAQ